MKTSDLIEENNILREELSPENKAFYEDLLVLVRIKSFFRDERLYEETLYGILQDLIEAQYQGQTAQEYLGADLEQIATDIAQESPRDNLWRMLKLVFKTWVSFILVLIPVHFMGDFIFSPQHRGSIPIGSVLVSSIYTLFLIFAFFKFLETHSTLALKLANKSFWWLWLRSLVPACFVFGIYVLIIWLTQNLWVIRIG